MTNPFTADPEQTGSAAQQQSSLPVIDPGLLIAALEAAGWVKAGELDDGHVVMAPHGQVIIPLDKGDPFYAREMENAVRDLEHRHGLRPSLLEGVVKHPDEGIMP